MRNFDRKMMTSESRENLHTAPSRYREFGFWIKKNGEGSLGTQKLEVQSPLYSVAQSGVKCVFVSHIRVQRTLQGGELNALDSIALILFLSIFGWFVRARFIWPGFSRRFRESEWFGTIWKELRTSEQWTVRDRAPCVYFLSISGRSAAGQF